MSLQIDAENDVGLPPSALFEAEPDEPRAVDRSDPEVERVLNVWRRVLVMSLLEYWLAPPSSVRYKEALEWIFYSDRSSANSFDNVCCALGMPPTKVRAMAAARCSEFRNDKARAEVLVREMQSNGFRVPT